MRVLFVGDVVGRPGREALSRLLPALKQAERPDLVLVNGENAAGGIGITQETAADLFDAGADLVTLGNHAWAKRDVYDYLDLEPRIVRPLNYPGHPPGQGQAIVKSPDGRSLAVINLCGRVFLDVYIDCPFGAVSRAIEEIGDRTPFIIVDVHAEATSEKAALANYLDGRVSAVVGTHTHVQTADERILPRGTAFITDVGMTGPINSIIGVDRDRALQRFLTQLPVRLEVAEPPCRLDAVVLELDEPTGRAAAIRRVQLRED